MVTCDNYLFVITRTELPFSSGNCEELDQIDTKSKCPCPYSWCVEPDKMGERHMYLSMYIYFTISKCDTI
jgi:hypothetical protein